MEKAFRGTDSVPCECGHHRVMGTSVGGVDCRGRVGSMNGGASGLVRPAWTLRAASSTWRRGHGDTH